MDWEGYGPENHSWVPTDHVHVLELVQQFHVEYLDKPCPSAGRGLWGDGVMDANVSASGPELLATPPVAPDALEAEPHTDLSLLILRLHSSLWQDLQS